MITPQEVLTRLLVAALFGALIGLERERSGKAAGLKTNMIVAISSALITVVSVDAFVLTDSTARVVTGVLTGIGFIGAGTIMQHENYIDGLTTAAAVWGVAIIGMVTGLGYVLYSLWATTLIMVVFYLKPLEQSLRKK